MINNKPVIIVLLILLICNVSNVCAQAPTITPKTNVILTLDATGNYTVALADVATVTNTQPNSVISISPTSFDCSSLGNQIVTVTASNPVTNPLNVNLTSPLGLTIDAAGNLYVTEFNFYGDVKMITPAGVVTTYVNSTAENILTAIEGIGLSPDGNMYITSFGENTVDKVTPAKNISVFAGVPFSSGNSDEVGNNVPLNGPIGIAIDKAGNIYVTDLGAGSIRKITPNGYTTTLAGGLPAGFADGVGNAAAFNRPFGLAIDAAGNLYVGDTDNNRIRKITPDGTVTTIAGNSTAGAADGTGTAATFNKPTALTVDAASNIYVDDTGNQEIRKITPAGVVTTIAGNGTAGDADGNGKQAIFNGPNGIAVDAAGNLYIADTQNNKIRKITPQGDVSTYAGSGQPGDLNGITADINQATAQIPVTVQSSNVTAPAPGVSISPNFFYSCVGLQVTYTATVINPGNNLTYQWQVNGQNAGENLLTFTSSTLTGGDIITCTIITTANCSILTATSNQASLTTDPSITNSVTITSSAINNTILQNESVTFTAKAAYTTGITVDYQWQINGQNTGSDNPVFTARHLFNNDVVSCYIITTGKCIASPQAFSNNITIIVAGALVITNAFTPNGDGINDTWDLPVLSTYPQCMVNIFNRYGALVYKSTGYAKAWDGTDNGKALPTGVYYYVIDLKDGNKPMAGPVTIIR